MSAEGEDLLANEKDTDASVSNLNEDTQNCSYCDCTLNADDVAFEALPCCSKPICIECSYDISINLNENIDTKCKLCNKQFDPSHRFSQRSIQPLNDQTFLLEQVDSFKSILKNLDVKNDEFISNRVNYRYHINEYCDRIRYDVFSSTESAIKHINKINDELITHINKYEAALLKDIDENDSESNFRSKVPGWESLSNELREFNSKWTENLKDLNAISSTQIESVKQAATERNILLETAQKDLKKELFGDKFMRHKENDSFFESKNHIGYLYITNSRHEVNALKTLNGHSDTVQALAVLSNGDLVSASDDETIKIWNIYTYQIKRTIHAHTDWIRSLAVLSNGYFIASGSYDKKVKIWNSNDGQLIKELIGHASPVLALVSLKDDYLASSSSDGTIKIWDILDGVSVRTIHAHTMPISAMAAVLDFKLASGSDDQTIKIWNLNNGELIETFKSHSFVASLAFSPLGYLISGSTDGSISVWSIYNSTLIETVKEHSKWVRSIVSSTDGFNLISASDDEKIIIWNNNYKKIRTLEGHKDPVRVLVILLNGYLASGSVDNTIKIWNTNFLAD